VKIQLSKAVGVLVCLAGGFLMVWGDPILGENHTGFATMVGIIGIGIITSSNSYARKRRKMMS
jgi:hypothetical protein